MAQNIRYEIAKQLSDCNATQKGLILDMLTCMAVYGNTFLDEMDAAYRKKDTDGMKAVIAKYKTYEREGVTHGNSSN